eukprot:TRINITY_DN16674_c0_g1_i1.p1 TRINITY_DN16674_c0_g1~~TRINITY_DN16674_c0_g1_i1.p1  ORF type:complete len:411 (+),score=122.20 TRINITY_DN16674_c0_g1_i1:179-1234(+)
MATTENGSAPAAMSSESNQPPRSILAAVDPSEESAYAFSWYLDNMARPADKVTSLSVEEVSDFSFFLKPEDIDELENQRREEVQKLLAKFSEKAKEKGVTTVSKTATGDARQVICEKAEKDGYELLVMGSRGLGAIKRTFLGSVSDYCLHQASCPILVVRKKALDGVPKQADGPRKVAVAVDDSEGSAHSFDWALENVARLGDLVLAIHIRSPAYLRYPVAEMGMGEYYMPPDVIADMEKSSAEQAEKLVRKFVKRAVHEYKMKCEGYVFRGDARELLVEETEKLGAAVLVMGSRGLGAISRTILGSVSDYCAHHCPCPVLVVKQPKTDVSAALKKDEEGAKKEEEEKKQE